jgi:hypothetical protein
VIMFYAVDQLGLCFILFVMENPDSQGYNYYAY